MNHSIKNCFYSNSANDLVIEFITRKEGIHKVFFFVNDNLVDDNPFLVYINGDSKAKDLLPEGGFLLSASSYQIFCPIVMNDSFLEPMSSSSDSQVLLRGCSQPSVTYTAIFCSKLNEMFHFVMNQANIQGLNIYGKKVISLNLNILIV